jgi:hypothetical protein
MIKKIVPGIIILTIVILGLPQVILADAGDNNGEQGEACEDDSWCKTGLTCQNRMEDVPGIDDPVMVKSCWQMSSNSAASSAQNTNNAAQNARATNLDDKYDCRKGAKCPATSVCDQKTGFCVYPVPNFLFTNDPNIVVGRVIKYIIGLSGTLAMIMFMFGGFQWITSAGKPENIKKGQNYMLWSAIGLIFTLTAYIFVNFLLKLFSQ